MGCGWLGKALAKEMLDAGYTVLGSSRTTKGAAALTATGIHAHVVELEASFVLPASFLESDVLLVAVTSKAYHGHEKLLDQLTRQQNQRHNLYQLHVCLPAKTRTNHRGSSEEWR